MHQQTIFSLHPRLSAGLMPFFGSDSIGTIRDSVPVHPEDKHPTFEDFKQKNKRKPHTDSAPDEHQNQHPESDHQIDEFV